MTSKLAILTIVLFFAAFSIISCNKTSQDDLTPEEELELAKISSESDAQAEIIFNGIFDDVMGVNDEVGLAGTGIFGVTTCLTVTEKSLNPPSHFPLRIVIEFENGCLGSDGHRRYGKIITTYTNRLIIPGAMATTTFDGFRIDNISVQGTLRVKNTGTVNIPQFGVMVEGGRISKPNGDFLEWNSLKKTTQIEGLVTAMPLDDAFRIEGSSNGTVRDGELIVAWRTEIDEPLFKRYNCKWIVKGRIRIGRLTSSGTSPWKAILDYGNGTCDRRAIISIDGTLYEITLH